jgi:hypothetical protein
MKDLTEEQQNAIDKCYEILKQAGLEDLEVGLPIPPRRPK